METNINILQLQNSFLPGGPHTEHPPGAPERARFGTGRAELLCNPGEEESVQPQGSMRQTPRRAPARQGKGDIQEWRGRKLTLRHSTEEEHHLMTSSALVPSCSGFRSCSGCCSIPRAGGAQSTLSRCSMSQLWDIPVRCSQGMLIHPGPGWTVEVSLPMTGRQKCKAPQPSPILKSPWGVQSRPVFVLVPLELCPACCRRFLARNFFLAKIFPTALSAFRSCEALASKYWDGQTPSTSPKG